MNNQVISEITATKTSNDFSVSIPTKSLPISSERALDLVKGGERVSILVRDMNDTTSLLAKFISEEDVEENSRKVHVRTLSQFFKWVRVKGYILGELTKSDILQYKDYLLHELNLSVLTSASYLSVVRNFYTWTEDCGLYPNIARGVKNPSRKQTRNGGKETYLKEHLSESKSRELISYFESKSERESLYESKCKRDYAIVYLMLKTGLRDIEVSRLNVGDISYKGETRILKIWGKGHVEKDDYVVLTDKTLEPIKAYLATRKGAKGNEPLFVSTSNHSSKTEGNRLSTRSISSICKEGLKAIGLEGKEYTAHSLRHTTAVTLINNGCDLLEVKAVLRHSSVTTTQIYLESALRERHLRTAPEMKLDNVL